MATPRLHHKIIRTAGVALRNPVTLARLSFIFSRGNNRLFWKIKKIYTILNYPKKCYIKGLDVRQAAELAITHHQIYNEHFTQDKESCLPIAMWSAVLSDNTPIHLELNNADSKYFYEGELSICLMSNREKISELSFIFKSPTPSEQKEPAILLTRIQGEKAQHITNQKISKHMKDMNTKYLLMSALSGFVAHFNIQEVYAIPAHRQPSFRENNQSNNFVDLYNKLWESYGGYLSEENLYRIPSPLSKQQDLEHSRHRSRSRHHEVTRNGVSSEVAAQLRRFFTH